MLLSCSLYIEGFDSFKVKNLKGLSPKRTIDLLLLKIPSEESYEKIYDIDQILELDEYTREVADKKTISKLKICKTPCMKHKHNPDLCSLSYLESHPLIEVLAGQPLSICMIACLL